MEKLYFDLICVIYAFRYLLKNQANVLLKNNAGDLPIHLACQYARQGHKYGVSLLPKFFEYIFCHILKYEIFVCSVHLIFA